MKLLKAIGPLTLVTVAIFIKVFPLSGILCGFIIILFLSYFGGFSDFRTWFRRPKSWWNCVAMALLASVASMSISYILLRLFRASPFGGPDYSRFSVVHGNAKLLLIWLLVIWTLVAFGEEIIGRGFIINRLLVVFERTFNPPFLAIAVSAVIFGLFIFTKAWLAS